MRSFILLAFLAIGALAQQDTYVPCDLANQTAFENATHCVCEPLYETSASFDACSQNTSELVLHVTLQGNVSDNATWTSLQQMVNSSLGWNASEWHDLFPNSSSTPQASVYLDLLYSIKDGLCGQILAQSLDSADLCLEVDYILSASDSSDNQTFGTLSIKVSIRQGNNSVPFNESFVVLNQSHLQAQWDSIYTVLPTSLKRVAADILQQLDSPQSLFATMTPPLTRVSLTYGPLSVVSLSSKATIYFRYHFSAVEFAVTLLVLCVLSPLVLLATLRHLRVELSLAKYVLHTILSVSSVAVTILVLVQYACFDSDIDSSSVIAVYLILATALVQFLFNVFIGSNYYREGIVYALPNPFIRTFSLLFIYTISLYDAGALLFLSYKVRSKVNAEQQAIARRRITQSYWVSHGILFLIELSLIQLSFDTDKLTSALIAILVHIFSLCGHMALSSASSSSSSTTGNRV